MMVEFGAKCYYMTIPQGRPIAKATINDKTDVDS